MSERKIRVPQSPPLWLFAVILLIALLLRLLRLGESPFTSNEALLAWAALPDSSSVGVVLNPALAGLNRIAFFIFGPSTFTARLWPALAGSLLCLLPLVWSGFKPTWRQALFALVLACETTLVALSRQADGPMLAIAALSFGLLFLLRRKYVPSGICLALAWLSGVDGLYILLSVAVGGILTTAFDSELLANLKAFWTESVTRAGRIPARFFIAIVVSLVAVSTAFLLQPSGLGGLGSGFANFFRNPVYRFWQLIYLWLRFTLPIIVVYFLVIIWKRTDKALPSKWFMLPLVGTVLSLLLGFFSLAPMAVFHIVLWAMIAHRLFSQPLEIEVPKPGEAGLLVFFVVLLVYLNQALGGLSGVTDLALIPSTKLFAAIAGLLLLILSFLLIGFGWSFKLALTGLVGALVVIYASVTISAAVTPIKTVADLSPSIWSSSPTLMGSSEIDEILNDLSQQGVFKPGEVSYAISRPIAENWRWNFAKWGQPNAISPQIALSLVEDDPQFETTFRGTSLGLTSEVEWDSLNGRQVLQSSPVDLPTNKTEGILWINSDFFQGEYLEPNSP